MFLLLIIAPCDIQSLQIALLQSLSKSSIQAEYKEGVDSQLGHLYST